MGKKRLKIRVRRVWRINPKTRIREDKKGYSRRSGRAELKRLLGEEK